MPCGGSLQFSHDLPLDDLLICYGVLGERLKMAQHKHHKTIKKLHQEHNTPPWIKTVTPFIYHNDQLLAVGDWQRETFKQLLEVNNCQYSWQKPEQIL